MMYLKGFKKSAEELRRLMNLRRSNASGAIRSGKAYTRKDKHKKHLDRED